MASQFVRFGAAGLVCLGAACASDASTGVVGSSPTEIVVEPEAFLHGAVCGPTDGSMRSYVVTLLAFDDANDTTPFTLPSSRPLPCSVTFAMRDLVVAGQRYSARIDGYEQDAASLLPFGGDASGSRQMLDANGDVIAPRWTTTCGVGASGAVVATTNGSNTVTGCAPLVDALPSDTTIIIDPVRILDEDACTVTKELDLRVLEGTLALPPLLACDAAPLSLSALPGALVRFYARATRPDGSMIGSECDAMPSTGLHVSPSCSAFSSEGAVTVAPHLVSSNACPTGALYEVKVNGEASPGQRIPCGIVAQLGPLAPGLVNLEVVLSSEKGAPLEGGATCKAEIEPGRVASAACL